MPAAAALNLGLLPGAALDHPIGRKLALIPCAALGASGVLLAIDDQSWMPRIGVLLLVPLFVWHASRDVRLHLLPFLRAVLFLALLATWHTEGLEQSLLFTAALVSGFFAVSGLTLERRPISPLPWASLAASVPVLALAICYARVTEFQPRIDRAGFAALLAAALTGTTARALRDDARQRAGVHATGAVAALALGCAMFLRDEWLTIAVSLFLPALAWITAQVELPALRRVALAVAAVVLFRLLLTGTVLDLASDGRARGERPAARLWGAGNCPRACRRHVPPRRRRCHCWCARSWQCRIPHCPGRAGGAPQLRPSRRARRTRDRFSGGRSACQLARCGVSGHASHRRTTGTSNAAYGLEGSGRAGTDRRHPVAGGKSRGHR